MSIQDLIFRMRQEKIIKGEEKYIATLTTMLIYQNVNSNIVQKCWITIKDNKKEYFVCKLYSLYYHVRGNVGGHIKNHVRG